MKMNHIRTLSALAVVSLVTLAACSAPDSEPQTNSEPVAPSQLSDFATLYAQNCAGCHGGEGSGGASFALANPVYLAIVDETTMRNIVANGVRGTSMPAFLVGGANKFLMEPIHHRTRQKPPGMSIEVNSCSGHIAHPATAPKAAERPREAPSPMIHSWRC
jgi:hypothetical protein